MQSMYKLRRLRLQGCKTYRQCIVAVLEGEFTMKQIQISEELFIKLIQYHFLDKHQLQVEIEEGLNKKIDSISMRLLYSQYKTAPTEEEKEKARKEYLDRRGVPGSFRW